jgi:hypothetical protein
MPFADKMRRDIHFIAHGHKFGITDPATYEQMADQFLFGACDSDTRECIRQYYPHRVRFKHSNRHFGVARVTPACIKTFYPVSAVKIANRGGYVAFFAYECQRNDL